MSFDILGLIREAEGRNYELHDEHVNPRFAKTLRTIGFDRCYTRAQGPYLWDHEGRRYIDMLSGYGVFNLGRNNPTIRQALIDFLQEDYPSLVQMEAPLLSGLLAKELKARMPNQLDYVFFTNSGAEGVEAAIKYARAATGKPAILHAKKAFHGLSNGALSLNGDTVFRETFEPLLPECRMVPFNDLAALEQALAAGDVAAFIIEPVQGKGVNIPSPGYLREAAALCRKHGALFVADEVQSGMGRTGRFLACEHDGDVDPDIVILSKSLSGGYVPVGAVLTRQWIFDRVFPSLEKSVVHSSTFGQGSLAMVAGLATLHVLDEGNYIARAADLGDRIGQGLQALVPQYEFMKEVRWRGLMVAIEFAKPESFALRSGWEIAHRMDKSLFPQAITMPLLQEHGMITQVAGHHIDVVKLLPPMVLSDADVDEFIRAFAQVMKGLHRFPGPVWETLSRMGRSSIGWGKKHKASA
ncbi:acetylornithine/succinyldiaminopimelate/putrescine aminotransferase [Methylohalomonas lacus]|uniref:Acetylornithine/succinyldiaminopimelate/putresci ne aminotransferase n=1 Tax=Methylohalomonas lacus TaxID=398773 RepID=A0AAE3L3X4_9GAMM|nr:aspartate aminotransferase family protein [Methylohalomonas lacus]MCS3902933.1 acetylornithine/succinyldiaminopimelate/putrescine aminotransferase [Methylohalomonas lacus]